MKTIFFNFVCFIFILSIHESFVASDNVVIEKEFIDGLNIFEYTLNPGKNTYKKFVYNISDFPEGKFAFTIHSSKPLSSFSIDCRQYSSDNLTNSFNKENICTSFPYSDYNIFNILVKISRVQEYPILLLRILNPTSSQVNITFYIRESESYKIKLKTEEILNPVSYVAYEIDIQDYYFNKVKEKDFLLFTQKSQFLIYKYYESK